MNVCREYFVLSGRGLCDELITRPEESYRLWCVVVCDLESSRMRRPWLAWGRSATEKNVCDKLINSTDQSRWESDSSSPNQEIARMLRKPKIRNRLHNSVPLDTVSSSSSPTVLVL
jgi:hypothetical protein